MRNMNISHIPPRLFPEPDDIVTTSDDFLGSESVGQNDPMLVDNGNIHFIYFSWSDFPFPYQPPTVLPIE